MNFPTEITELYSHISPVYSFITASICLAFGRALKGLSRFPDTLIPFALALIGGVAYAILVSDSGQYSASDYVIGVFIGLSSVGLHQTFHQVAKSSEEK